MWLIKLICAPFLFLGWVLTEASQHWLFCLVLFLIFVMLFAGNGR